MALVTDSVVSEEADKPNHLATPAPQLSIRTGSVISEQADKPGLSLTPAVRKLKALID